ncbi:MAG TPA: GTPase [Tepidisphaeraceae bacterium]|jgi:small GTP-binding protein|nr:GTPase [Tepidisphaeraceae bacterium]
MHSSATENQAIQLTPPGSAAIAVVRLLGPGVPAFLGRYFSKIPRPDRCVHGNLTDGQRIIDDPVVILLATGGADVNLHGGVWVVRSALDLARRDGFSIVESAVDFPSVPQAVDGETVLEKEVASHLPLARSEIGIRVLLAQRGAWSHLNNPLSADQIEKILDDRGLYHLLYPPAVAIVGAANVGKSTLANQLFGQERSITADIAGTTRDWVGEIANVDGLPVMLVDTPGQRATDDVIERAAIAASRAAIEASQLVILVLDATRPLEPEQSHLLTAYPGARVVANKCDQPWAWDVERIAAIQTTATTGVGLNALRRAIASYFSCADIEINKPRWWTQRQREILRRTMTDPQSFWLM